MRIWVKKSILLTLLVTSGPCSVFLRAAPPAAPRNFRLSGAGGSCVTSAGTWQNVALASQDGTFTVEFDATPSLDGMDGVAGLSNGAASDYPQLASIVRFNTSGTIDARNGGSYAAVTAVSYSAGLTYHFRLMVNVVAHTYSAYSKQGAAAEQLIASNYAFRTEQQGVASLSNMAAYAATGSAQICGVAITASAPPPAPAITSALTASGNVGSAFSYLITASNSPASFNATGLPAGLSINSATGLISGTPSGTGTSDVTISATNTGGTGSATLMLTINAAAAPVITSVLTATGNVGSAFSYQITATNGPTSYNAAGLPAGLSVNTGTGLISGTPSAEGAANVTISATNAGGSDSDTLVITVNAGGTETYDNRIGLGSDGNGVPLLTKHASARYIYWNPSHGSAGDGNAGTSPDAPKATLRSAWEALRDGYGDWLLMAQSATNTNGFNGYLAARSGLNAQYPIVVTTYDPADPYNVSAMRQGKVTIGTAAVDESQGLALYNYSGQNIVFENIDIVYGSTLGSSFSGLTILNWPGAAHTMNLLFHNVRTVRTQVSIQSTPGETQGTSIDTIIFRHCAFAYSQNQGMYMWGTDGVTVEDSVFYHNGWSADGNRDTATQQPNIFDHNAYYATQTWNTIFRRNVSGHASSHGLQLRGGGIAHDNVLASNPVNLILGGGDDYNTLRPTGVPYDAQNNVLIGSSDINSSTPRGFGVGFENTQDGGTFHNNIIANIGSLSTVNRRGFVTTWISTEFNVPTYINLTNNIIWNWNNEETLQAEFTYRNYPAQLYFTYSGNVIEFDAAPTGDNRNTPVTAYPDPGRTLASYATANGYGSESALWADMVANPRTAWARTIGDYIRAGYGR